MKTKYPFFPVAAAACAALVAVSFSCVQGTRDDGVSAGYRVDPFWPKKPDRVKWGDMPGVAVDAKDRVWIFTRSTPAVQAYDASTGALVVEWHPPDYGKAHHIKIGPEGNVWLADIERHTVRKHSPDGKLLLTLGTPGVKGEDASRLNMPTDMAITPAGDIFISDGYGNNRIVHFDKNGRYVKAWGRKGIGAGEFNLPHGIGVDSKGRLYVADRSNARIQVFDQSGTFLAKWEGLLVPWSIWITRNDGIWTSGSSHTSQANAQGQTGIPPHDQVFMKFDVNGKLLRRWSPPLGDDLNSQPGETAWVHIVAEDSKGNLYAGDIKGQRVQKFVPLR